MSMCDCCMWRKCFAWCSCWPLCFQPTIFCNWIAANTFNYWIFQIRIEATFERWTTRNTLWKSTLNCSLIIGSPIPITYKISFITTILWPDLASSLFSQSIKSQYLTWFIISYCTVDVVSNAIIYVFLWMQFFRNNFSSAISLLVLVSVVSLRVVLWNLFMFLNIK